MITGVRCGSRGYLARQRTYKMSSGSWLLLKLIGLSVPKRLFNGVLAAMFKDERDNMMVYISTIGEAKKWLPLKRYLQEGGWRMEVASQVDNQSLV